MTFHVVQPYGPPGDYAQATVVATLPNAEAAWESLDALHARMNASEVPLDYVDLVVVDDERRPVSRPVKTISSSCRRAAPKLPAKRQPVVPMPASCSGSAGTAGRPRSVAG
jgi:hypothetical protein